jgi:hypothetical protein
MKHMPAGVEQRGLSAWAMFIRRGSSAVLAAEAAMAMMKRSPVENSFRRLMIQIHS